MSKSGLREGWVDSARGIAIILVVLGHAIHIVARQDLCPCPAFFDILDRMIYTFHVPLFFFISGSFFASSYANRGTVDLLKRRSVYLLYPYVIWSVIQTTMDVIRTSGWQQKLMPELLEILYFPKAHFWFLFVLFFCGAIGIGLHLIFVKKIKMIWALLIVSLVWYGLHPLIPGGPIKDIGVYLPYFAIGCLWRELSANIRLRAGWIATVSISVIFVCVALFTIAWDKETYMPLRLPIGLLGVAATCIIANKICSLNKTLWLTYIGKNSIAIYLIHVLAIHAIFIPSINYSYPVAISIATVAGIGFPLLFRVVCVKAHISKLLGLS